MHQSLHIHVFVPQLLLFTCSFEFLLDCFICFVIRSMALFIVTGLFIVIAFPTKVGGLASSLNFGRLILSPFATSATTIMGRASIRLLY